MKQMNQLKNTRKRNTLITLAVMLAVSVLFTLGEYWDFTDGVIKEILFLAADGIMLVLIPLLAYRSSGFNTWMNAKIDGFEWKKKKGVYFRNLLLYAAGIPVSLFTAAAVSNISGIHNNIIVQLCLLSAVWLILTVCLLRKSAYEHLDRLFLCTVMIIGTLFVVILPARLGYSWDDQIHYDRTLSAATLDGPYYEADMQMYLSAWDPAENATALDRETWESMINQSYAARERTPYNHGDMRHISIIGYFNYGVGTVLARGIGLPYTTCFRLSKLMNVLVYGLVIAMGIRRLKYGKVLAATVGLIPTNMYMASSYSYDPWLTSFLILGYCCFFGALQKKDEKLTDREIAIMLGAFLIGCLPKAIYCVCMLPLLFMPRDKFVSKKQYALYLTAGFTVVFLLLSTFIVPRFLYGAGSGDERGGEGVNASGQIAFIMSHPKEYLSILLNFLKNEYLTAWSAGAYSVNYAYLGVDHALWYAVPVMIFLTAQIDKNGSYGRTAAITVSAMISFVILIAVIASSMYISFTPVGHHTVNGCQPRYLIPLLFPAWYINSFDRVNLKWNRNLLPLMMIAVMGLINIVSLGSILASIY